MGIEAIERIGIATPSLDETLPFYRDVLGLELAGIEEIAEQGVRVAKLRIGESFIELLEPLSDASPVARFLERRGPGVHHVAYRTGDIAGDLRRCGEKGVALVDAEPRVGASGTRIAFVHPSATGKVLTELCERR